MEFEIEMSNMIKTECVIYYKTSENQVHWIYNLQKGRMFRENEPHPDTASCAFPSPKAERDEECTNWLTAKTGFFLI